jgi:hypothetical protein
MPFRNHQSGYWLGLSCGLDLEKDETFLMAFQKNRLENALTPTSLWVKINSKVKINACSGKTVSSLPEAAPLYERQKPARLPRATPPRNMGWASSYFAVTDQLF